MRVLIDTNVLISAALSEIHDAVEGSKIIIAVGAVHTIVNGNQALK